MSSFQEEENAESLSFGKEFSGEALQCLTNDEVFLLVDEQAVFADSSE